MLKASTGSTATYVDRYGVSDDFIYDLDKCLSWSEKVFIKTFPAKYSWDKDHQLISRNKNTQGKVIGRFGATNHLVCSVCLRSARYKKVGNEVKRPGGIIREVRLDRMVFSMTFGPIPPNCYVAHIDGDRTNNRPENLELRLLRTHTPVPPGVYDPPGAVTPDDIDLGPLKGFDDIDQLKDYLSRQF